MVCLPHRVNLPSRSPMLPLLRLARSSVGQSLTRLFRTSPLRRGLEEFYDTKNHLRVNENPVAGRAWEASELRRKSFTDLHKLWYVLLKERNALLTESTRARRFNMRIKYPQRKTAVRKSMGRIKQVGSVFLVAAIVRKKCVYQVLAERRAAYREVHAGLRASE